MSFVGIAVGVGGAVVGGTIAAKGAKSAAKTQANAQLEATDATNEANKEMFYESRGRSGHAFLPEYFGTFEKDLAGDLTSIYKGEGGTTSTNTFGDEAYASLTPAVKQGNQLVSNVMSGQVGNERVAQLDNISASRRAGINQGLGERLSQIRTNRLRTGLGGGSSFENNLATGSTIAARVSAGEQDALDRARVYDENFNLQAQFMNEPFNRAQQSYTFGNMPGDQATNAQYRDIDALMQRLGYFNIGTGQPPAMQTPQVPFIPNTGMAVGSAISQGAGALGQYYAMKAMQPQTPWSPAGYPTSIGSQYWGASGSAPAAVYTPGQNAAAVNLGNW